MPPIRAPQVVPLREVRHFAADDGMHFESIARRGRMHDWTIPAHRHEALWQFHLLTAGDAEVEIDGTPHPVVAPALWSLAPGTVHAVRYSTGANGQQLTLPQGDVAAMLGAADALAGQLAACAVLNLAAAGAADEITALFARIGEEFESDRPGRTVALSALATLLLLWVLRNGTAAGLPRAGAHAARDTLIRRLRNRIEAHFREQHGVAFYAASLNVTPDHLTRTCRQLTGQSTLELVRDRVLLEARRALTQGDAPVASIAQSLGFVDAAYFSRLFARATGMSPSAYRIAVDQGRVAPPRP